jgi:ectoine hydroxylase
VRPSALAPEELRLLRAAADRVDALASSWSDRGKTYALDGLRFRDVDQTTLQYEHGDDANASGLARVLEPVHPLDPVFDALVDDPRLAEPARDLVGSPGLSLFTDKLNLKRARFGSACRWHQDSPYWAHLSGVWERIDHLPNVLVQLDASSTANGCFVVHTGSHRRGALPGTPDGSTLGPLFTDPLLLDPANECPLALPAGSLVFFHPHLVHGSRANRSDRDRRAVELTYQAAGHRMLKLDRERAVAG